MGIAVESVDAYQVLIDRRMVLSFGKTDDEEEDEDGDEAVNKGERLLLAIEFDIDGASTVGLSMGATGATWFVKGSEVPPEEGDERLIEAVEYACQSAGEVEADTPFAFWQALYDRQREWGEGTIIPPLLWGYGVSLVEQAAIDAYCRRHDLTFADAVRENQLGLDLTAFHEELADESADELLPPAPLSSVSVRHTVGQTDPLTDDDLTPAERLDDGLPQTLGEYVTEQGIDHLKIKLTADLDFDIDRLATIEDVLHQAGCSDYAFTLDANEAYGTATEFRRQWEQLREAPELETFLPNLLYVEQPLARRDAFSEETAAVFNEWEGAPPVIIDESDDAPDSLRRALECGYAGTSHKNCKGAFKGIANRCLLAYYSREKDQEYLMSGEDLTTVGPVGLLEDLAVMGTLGLDHVERNGHHYFRGLSGVPESVQSSLLDAHGDLYTRHEGGFASLDIQDGRIEIGSVVRAPFGRDFDLETAGFDPYPGFDG